MRFWTFLKALIFLYLYSNLQKNWLKTYEDIASQRLDTIYNILKIYIRYIYYIHGQMSWMSCPWTLSHLITSTGSGYLLFMTSNVGRRSDMHLTTKVWT